MSRPRWDARWKLAVILLACLAAVSLTGTLAALIALALALGLATVAGVPIQKICSRLGLILLSLIPFLAILPFQYESGRGLYFHADGARFAALIALKALTVGALVSVLVAGPVDQTLAAARSLGVPGPLVIIALLTSRYAKTFADEWRRLRVAWRVRAFSMTPSLHTYRTVANGFGAVLVHSGERGERVGAAMRARGFDGTFHAAVPFHTTPRDVILSCIVVGVAIGLVSWDRLA